MRAIRVKIGLLVYVLMLALLLGACGTGQSGSGNSQDPKEQAVENDADTRSEPSEPTSAGPEYRVVNEEDYPIEDADGPIPAKTLVVQAEETSDSALRGMAELIRDEYPDQDIIGMNFGDFLNPNFQASEADFVVMVRNGRAAGAMGLTDEEFADGGIAVNPEGAEQAAQDQYGGGESQPTAEEDGGVGVATVRVSGTEGLAFEGLLTSLESSRSVEGTVPMTYEIEYQTGLFASDYVDATMNKAFATNPQPGTLRVEILVDGQVVNSTETSSEYGTASVSWDTASGS